jgi:small subunit ribosomal protein S20
VANTTSAQKAMRQAVRRAARNRAAKSAVRTYVKKAAAAVASNQDDAAEVVRQAVRSLDKAAQKGIVHPNAAARRKSRLMSRLHQLSLSGADAPVATDARARKAPANRATARGGARSATRRPSTSRKSAAR